MDRFTNFARSTLASGIAAGAVSCGVSAGTGTKFPTAPFNATIWNATDYPSPDLDPTVEVVRVTVVATDTFTITRAQEGTADSAHNTGGKTYGIISSPTAFTLNSLVHRKYRRLTTTGTLTDETHVLY